MQVNEVMSSDVRIANPQQSIREAAQMMVDIDAGVLPVGENDRLVGMITDRDIAVRAVAAGKGPDTPGERDHERGGEVLLRHRRGGGGGP